jgi:hypothetical protein
MIHILDIAHDIRAHLTCPYNQPLQVLGLNFVFVIEVVLPSLSGWPAGDIKEIPSK